MDFSKRSLREILWYLIPLTEDGLADLRQLFDAVLFERNGAVCTVCFVCSQAEQTASGSDR